MKKETVEELINICREIEVRENELESAGVHISQFGKTSDKIYDAIITDFGIPQDTTLEEGLEPEDYFCRDCYIDLVIDYEEEKITIDELMNKLENWKDI